MRFLLDLRQRMGKMGVTFWKRGRDHEVAENFPRAVDYCRQGRRGLCDLSVQIDRTADRMYQPSRKRNSRKSSKEEPFCILIMSVDERKGDRGVPTP